ncbi:cytochrome c biogenesis CcdA family protein [Nocardioides sp. GCM10027113]|uniref:cytochrome c biogenesis CcdA family protein n=1 Tax=unclassified Nocardioides TaxID=2615069 RepID=UPI003605B5EE
MNEGLLAVALGAGMLAAVNPCGFALLPAYVSMLVAGEQHRSRPARVGRALLLTAAMTTGFAGVFALFGLAIAPVAAGVQEHLPWFTVVFGLTLLLMGLWLAAGRDVRLPRLPGRLGRRGRTGTARPLSTSVPSMAGFGAGYAVASLSCTVAPFLAVVVGGFRTGSVIEGLALFLAYAAGMGLVVGTLAVAVALASTSTVGRLRRAGQWAPRAAGGLLAVAGAYVAYYGWWELRVLRGGETADPVIDAAASLQRWLSETVAGVGAWTWLAVCAGLVLVTVAGSRLRRRTREPADEPSTGSPEERSRA